MTATEPGGPRWAPVPGSPPRREHAVDRTAVPVPRPCAPDEFRTPGRRSGLAWLVRPVTHVPGVLHLTDGRLRFVSTRGVIVEGSLGSLAISPARTGRGGFRLTVGDERLRLHVVRFPGAVDVPAELCDREVPGELLTAGEPTAGAAWRRLLAPSRPAPDAPVGPTADAAVPTSPEPSVRTVRVLGWRATRGRRACATPTPGY